MKQAALAAPLTVLFLASWVLSFFIAPVHAAGPGTSAATFLSLGFGARPLALGESFVALADDVSALHYNPAGLSRPLHRPFSDRFAVGDAGAVREEKGFARPYELLLSHSLHIQDIRLTQMGFVRRPFGLSVTHLNLGGIERRTSETSQPEGSFGASDLAVGLSYGRKVGKVGLGGTLKFIQQTIGERSASAYVLDVGALYRLKKAPVTLGAGIGNLGTKVRFIEEGYPLPLVMRLGASVGQTKEFPHAVSVEVDLPRDNGPVFRVGAEYLGFGPFAMRLGYRTVTGAQKDAVLGKALGSTASGLSEFYGMFMGAGFRAKAMDFDYTILPYGELGTAHRFSISMRFGGGRPFSAVAAPAAFAPA